MVSSDIENLVYDVRQSSVVPARVSGENKVHELTNMDLALKLHYIRGLYFFESDAVQGISMFDLKKPMFEWLALYSPVAGRIRRSGNGRPFIKCNDGGVRIVEARCTKTIDEWLTMEDQSLNDRLFYSHVLGPDLAYSPLVFIQFTFFKCGGLSVGLSWPHILGDAFSASAFLNMLGQIMAGHPPPDPLNMPNTGNYQSPHSISEKPFSLKRVEPVSRDYWLTVNTCKLEAHSFHFTAQKLDHIFARVFLPSQKAKPPYFPVLAALMWKSIAKMRGESEPRIVTICGDHPPNRENKILSNWQVIGTLEANFKIEKASLEELIELIDKKMVDERATIEDLVKRESESSEFILYGANLTFVNLEEAKIYGLQLKGKRPIFVNYTMAGIGGEGMVVVVPGRGEDKYGSVDGRVVTVILPRNEMIGFKNELTKEWGVF